MKLSHIYTLSDPRNGMVKYVGKTTNIKEREVRHKSISNNANKNKQEWVIELKKEGLFPVIEEIETTFNNNFELEMYWIDQMKMWGFDLFNITQKNIGNKISESLLGKQKAESHKRKLSDANKKNTYILYKKNCFVSKSTSLLDLKNITKLSLSHLSRLSKKDKESKCGYKIKISN